MTTHYHWYACQDGNGWADLDIAALSGECGYYRAGSGASCAKGILAPESSVGEAARCARPPVIHFPPVSLFEFDLHTAHVPIVTISCVDFGGLCTFMIQLQTRIFLIPVPPIWGVPHAE
jgi:hypothetical protein